MPAKTKTVFFIFYVAYAYQTYIRLNIEYFSFVKAIFQPYIDSGVDMPEL